MNISSEKGEAVKEFCNHVLRAAVNLGGQRATDGNFAHLAKDEFDAIKSFLKQCGKQYGLTIDCSSNIFCAEAVSCLVVDEELWHVIKFLAGLNLYKESPDGEETAASLLSFLK
eukprot:4158137-Ditylum_brightwellii.AAC.1